MKKGPEKGKVYEVVKRKLEMKSIGSVSLRLVWIWESFRSDDPNFTLFSVRQKNFVRVYVQVNVSYWVENNFDQTLMGTRNSWYY